MKTRVLLLCLLILSMLAMPVLAADNVTVTVDGTRLTFDQPPMIENDRTLVPVRAIFESLGATVDWEPSTETVAAYKGSNHVVLRIGSQTMVQDGKTVWLDVPPRIVGSRTLVPLRAVSEAFGAQVEWIAETQAVVITTGQAGTDSKPETTPNPDTKPEVTPKPEPTPDTKPEETPDIGENDYEKQVLTLVNQERAKQGLQPLSWNAKLAAVARAHSADMSARNYMSHTNPDGLSPFDRIKNSGISYTRAAENIAAGQRTPEAVMESWMNSDGHRQNILNPNLTELGVGFYQGSKGYKYYWTQCFITP